MPGGGGGRKKPFSGKQKKVQLQQAKKDRQQGQESEGHSLMREEQEGDEAAIIVKKDKKTEKGEHPPSDIEGSKFFEAKFIPSRMNAGRYALTFRAESAEEVMRLKREARKPVYKVDQKYLECSSEEFYTSAHLDFPIRPPWNYALSREELEGNEQRYFKNYLKKIDEKFDASELSYFELNLETWRQLWRVLEMSDILLFVVDIRFPPLLFPPRLYEYVCKELGKGMVLVLNKIDLCPPTLVLAWIDFLTKAYEGLHVICFTAYPSYNLHGNQYESKGLKMKKGKKVRGRLHMAAEGAMKIYKYCEQYVQDQVDLTTWKQKIVEEMHSENEGPEEDEAKVHIETLDTVQKQDTDYYEFEKFKQGTLTIGSLGQPNVGKSSLINALMGKKVVSVSKTPGHTKHFQTIHLTQNVRLCDCPGLIFPSKVPKPLQVLSGSYPIAQLREPYSTIQYLGQRLDLPNILGIQHPEGKSETVWNAFDLAEGWALKRGYYTAKAARLDSYRGANHILRLALDGRICLCLRPPGYSTNKDRLESDPRIADVLEVQGKPSGVVKAYEPLDEFDDDDEDEVPDETEADGEESSKPAPKSASASSTSVNSNRKEIRPANKFALLQDLDDDNDSN